MQYFTELHCHTQEVSPCANNPTEDTAERYIAAGYSALVVTDHYCDHVIDNAGDTWEKKIEHYLSGYRRMKEYAKGRLNVLLGCELRFLENYNDYLVYGMDEEFLLAHPNLHHMTLKSFSEFSKEHGLLLIQAHPFRKRMTVIDPLLLDGIEVFNGHRGHDSRNRLADMYARRYGLLRSSGSDFHHPNSVTSGGIITDQPMTSIADIIQALRSGECTLRCTGPAAALDGMTNMPAKYEKER